MKLVKQAMTVLGILVVITAIVALVTPKTAHAIVATMVEIVPGGTTHVGTTESNLVSLVCNLGAIPRGGGLSGTCEAVDATGEVSGTAYQVPTGSTLIVTDYEWQLTLPDDPNGCCRATTPDTYVCDFFYTAGGSGIALVIVPLLRQQSCALTDSKGLDYGREHFTTGIRVASGVIVYDNLAGLSIGSAALQGYLVPN